VTHPASPSLFGVARRDLARLRLIVRAIARHGFGELALRTPLGRRLLSPTEAESAPERAGTAAERFAGLLGSLGPTFTKLGQILSVRRDLLAPNWITALEALQDRAPELPFEQIRVTVEESLGATLEEAFAHFDPAPLATASIAQTHRARTHEGDEVVVKVQRPGIADVMRSDLDLLMLLAQVLEASVDEVRLVGVVDIVAEFSRGLLSELDFSHELDNLRRARAALDPDRPITAPRPHPELSAERVLTMGYFPGRSVRMVEPRSDRAKSATAEIVRTFGKQVFVDGLFHGDPHAGNLLIDAEGTVCMIDFGLVGTLDPAQRTEIVTLILGFITGDSSTVARTLLHMGVPTQRVNLEELKDEVVRMRAKYLTANVGRMNTRGFSEEFAAAAQRFRIKLTSDYALLIKSLATVEGVVRALDPDVDLVGLLRPFVQSVVGERLSPQALLGQLAGEASSVGSMLWRLPGQMDQLFHDFDTGNLQIRAVTPELDTLPSLVHQAGSRVALAFFAASMAICAAITFGVEPVPAYRLVLSAVLALLSAGAWGVLVLWHVVGRGKPLRLSPLLKALRAK